MDIFNTPDIADANPRVRALAPILKNLGGKKNFFGKIQTIKCPDDNSLIKEQLNSPGLNRVLVVDAKGVNKVALLGDMMAKAGIKNEWSGIIINGYVRDIDILKAMDIGVQALGTIPVKSEKRSLGEVGTNISFGGLVFKPGQYIYADNNGLLLSETELKF
ncbi:MAG: ribonuclease E activity regulator RraA [SAR86 cluster bacterium]|nr:ribonuclease E activity regulator RraA [SAR86 cluster bacterium]